MGQSTPPFYPPRAKWYSRIFYLGLSTRHRLALDRIHLPQSVTLGGLVAGALVPGLAVYLRGPRLWGKLALAASALLFLTFLLGFGYPVGNYAFGLLISVHVSGFGYYCQPFLREKDFMGRLAITALLLIVLGLGIYAPARGAIQRYYAVPLRLNGRVIVVERAFPAARIQRGDGIAYVLSGYYFSNHGGEGVSSRSGMSLGTVLAAPGDRVEFSEKGVSVNGTPRPALPHMPKSGTFLVPENHWFVWPNLVISGDWHVPEESISSAMLELANVSETQYVGKPFKRWFWREQRLP